MRPSTPASVALLTVLATSLLLIPAQAQINGAPASVTSPGFGGRPINGPRASVTSLGPQGFAPGPRAVFTAPGPDGIHRDGRRHHHRNGNGEFATPFLYAVPVPYAVDATAVDEDSQANDDDAEYQGGPTVFDRRGSGSRSYVPPVKDATTAHAAENSSGTSDAAPADPEPPLPPTLLVFKDGHKLEIGNYAIVGATLFDLTPGHPRRIALADLDLDATRRQNDDRGITFQLPQAPQAN
ncbi:MAG TPA: hypothetical protein VE377_02305 [Candidatus Dormibacteraeota bacterium]|nr:hypothetical protein [Candidatus Dormibacteraeota bacterium]